MDIACCFTSPGFAEVIGGISACRRKDAAAVTTRADIEGRGSKARAVIWVAASKGGVEVQFAVGVGSVGDLFIGRVGRTRARQKVVRGAPGGAGAQGKGTEVDLKGRPPWCGAETGGGIGNISGFIVNDPCVIKKGMGRRARCSRKTRRKKGKKERQQDPTKRHAAWELRHQELHLWRDQKQGPQGPGPWAG